MKPLPTIRLIEGLMLTSQVMRVGLEYASMPKISDEEYYALIKEEVLSSPKTSSGNKGANNE